MFTIPLLILIVTVSFSILILIHELGHFIAAKKSGVWVEEFGLGLPPRIWGKKIGETIYSINWLPIGGFVRLHGEGEAEKVTYPERSFLNKSPWIRIIITLAGVFMNIVLAIVCFSIVYSIGGIATGRNFIKVTEITSGSPAFYAQMQIGDIIKKINGEEVFAIDKFQDEIEKAQGKRVKIEVERGEGKELKELQLTPRINPPEGEGPLGVVITEIPEIYFPPLWQRPFVGTYYGFRDAFYYVGAVTQGLGQTAKSVSEGKAPEDVAGPIALISLFVEIARTDALRLIKFIGIVSANLAVINLIPFPPLDGYRVLTTFLEKLVGKKFLPRYEAIIHTVGMVILLSLMVLLTARELPALLKAGSISGFVDTLLK